MTRLFNRSFSSFGSKFFAVCLCVSHLGLCAAQTVTRVEDEDVYCGSRTIFCMLKHFKKDCDLIEIVRRAQPSAERMSYFEIKAFLEQEGLSSVPVRLGMNSKPVRLPIIVHLPHMGDG